MVGAAKGHRVHILMSDTASVERRQLIRQFGGTVQLFKATAGYATGIELSREMAADNPCFFLPYQFENPLNAHDHEMTTGVEIWSQMEGRVDAFVSGYGTGGTITGCSHALKDRNARVQIVAMEPAEAAMLAGEMPCCPRHRGHCGRLHSPVDQSPPGLIAILR